MIFGHKKSARRRFLLHPVRSVFFAADAATETLLETVDTTTGIHNFLLASIERVALGTYVQLQIMGVGRASLERVTAGTGGGNLFVLGVDTFFHGEPR